MNKKISAEFAIIVIILVAVIFGFLIWRGNNYENIENKSNITSVNVDRKNLVNKETNSNSIKKETLQNYSVNKNWKIYKSTQFGFSFKYPNNWYLKGNNLSSQKIESYEIGSDNSPINFGVYSKDKNVFLNNNEIFNFDDIQYQIDSDKRNSEDSALLVNGKEYKKFDLIDYGKYEGTGAGNVVIVISPKITKNNKEYYLVFEWEEKPRLQVVKNNRKEDFLNIISSVELE